MIATVKYQVGTYTGEVKLNCNENDEEEQQMLGVQ